MEIIQELFDIMYGAIDFLPDTKITIGIAIGLAILIYFRRTLGGLVTSILVTILVANSYFADGDLYQVSAEKASPQMSLRTVSSFSVIRPCLFCSIIVFIQELSAA